MHQLGGKLRAPRIRNQSKKTDPVVFWDGDAEQRPTTNQQEFMWKLKKERKIMREQQERCAESLVCIYS